MRAGKVTIDFLVVMQISERVEVHIALKCHMWPGDRQRRSFAGIPENVLHTPIPSVG